jgi:subtilisin family serine protease
VLDMTLRLVAFTSVAVLALAFAGGASSRPVDDSPSNAEVLVVGYASAPALERAVRRSGGRVLRRVGALRTAEVLARPEVIANAPGVRYVSRPVSRARAAEPGITPTTADGGPLEWQYAATRVDAVPEEVLRAAADVTIAVVDTGVDVTAPDLAAKSVQMYDVASGGGDAPDFNGHGTFVASLAAGSVTNGEGIAGFGGDANLLAVRASETGRYLTDVDAAAAIVYAVDGGAKIVNLSFGGPRSSIVERRAVDYAVRRGALLVAAVGNEFHNGNAAQYPAALLQPIGSRGRGGRGLAVGGSTRAGKRASFSNTGSHVSLVAPATEVLSAVSSLSSPKSYPRVALPGSVTGLYGFGSGTSYAAPQVAGAAALVWAANPVLTAPQVAQILKSTSSGRGRWNPRVGYGQIDVAAAVARAQARRGPPN